LVNRFVDRWKEKEKQPSIASKIKNIGKPSESLKQQISVVTQRINVQTRTLDTAVKRFESRDAELFKRVVKALSERDTARAKVFASELSEVRKVEKMLMHASLALESVSMRLNTVSELGDLVTVLAPAASVLNNIRSGMSTVFPEASQELENIGGLLSEIVTTTNQSTGMPMNVNTANLEAEKILEEAEIAAEKKLRDQFPEVAAGSAMRERTGVEA
jgi:division protein CdvB (Snf7/Vps24/ESCRT-III family)